MPETDSPGRKTPIQSNLPMLQIVANVASMLQDTTNVAEPDGNIGNGKQRHQRIQNPSNITSRPLKQKKGEIQRYFLQQSENYKLQPIATLQNWRPTWGLAMLHAT